MKWEDNIKTTLEERAIKPSTASWDSLADRLDAVDKKNSKTPFWWMGIAASVVAILFTVTMFFNGNTTETQEPVIVDAPQQVDDLILPVGKSSPQIQLVETHQQAESLEALIKNTAEKAFVPKQNTITTPLNQDVIIAKNKKEQASRSVEIIAQKETLEDQKVIEIIAQINNIKISGQTVTDADIDALLRKAQKEIAYQTILKEGTRTVDANALLQDVESDLQQSFRNKIFEALKNSFETVKTAVAERNN